MAGKLTGAEETAREGYRELLQDAATAQSQHPLVYGAGNVGGKVAQMAVGARPTDVLVALLN